MTRVHQDLTFDTPHRRFNPLTGEWVLVSAHRTSRPWQGQVEEPTPDIRPPYDPDCYLCPGNSRVGGAVNDAYGLYESHINLDVSYALMELLVGDGATVEMTRYDDRYLTNSDRYTFCNDQGATILISVHTNSVTDPTWDGSMALYAPNRDPHLAQAIHEVMYPYLRDTAPPGVADFRDFGLDNFASGVLFKCDMPAAMMEPLLMSHPAEAERLVTPVFSDPETGAFSGGCAAYECRRGQIAQAIYAGTLNYFSQQAENGMHIAAIDMSYQAKKSTYFINTAVTIKDSVGEAVSGAAVTAVFTLPDSSQLVETAVSGDDGLAAFKLRSRLSGTYSAQIVDVSKTSWLYDPLANVETSESLDVP